MNTIDNNDTTTLSCLTRLLSMLRGINEHVAKFCDITPDTLALVRLTEEVERTHRVVLKEMEKVSNNPMRLLELSEMTMRQIAMMELFQELLWSLEQESEMQDDGDEMVDALLKVRKWTEANSNRLLTNHFSTTGSPFWVATNAARRDAATRIALIMLNFEQD